METALNQKIFLKILNQRKLFRIFSSQTITQFL